MRGFLLLQIAVLFILDGEAQSIRLNEILADNDKIIADSAGEFDDVVELYNSGNETVNLFRWYPSDDKNNLKKFRFGNVTIAPGEFLLVWCDEDVLQPGIHANFRLNVNGEPLILTNDDETVVDSVTYPLLTENVSWARYPDAGLFKYMYPTIGRPNVFMSVPYIRPNQVLRAYPNPARTGSKVRFNAPVAKSILLDANGRQLKNIPENTMELDLGDILPGIYTLSVGQNALN